MAEQKTDGAFSSAVFTSSEPCWKCGKPLYLLEPSYFGWQYWCPGCRHVTAPAAELERGFAAVPPGAIGVVVAVPVVFTFTPSPQRVRE